MLGSLIVGSPIGEGQVNLGGFQRGQGLGGGSLRLRRLVGGV